jgi:hypothetical protein
MRIEGQGGKLGCSDPRYCKNGRPNPRPRVNGHGGPSCTIFACYPPARRQNRWANASTINSYFWQIAEGAEGIYTVGSRFIQTNSGYNYRVVGNWWSSNPLYGWNTGTLLPVESRSIDINSAITKSSMGWGAFGFALGTAVVGNAIDYGIGEHASTGIVSQEFAVSTAVDTALGYVVGAGTAALVGLALGASAPVLAVAAVTVVAGVGAAYLVNRAGIPKITKDGINAFIDNVQGE